MNKIVAGKAFVFGSNIDTDQIYPGRYLALTDPKLVAEHAMEGADSDFVNKVQPGDIVVAAKNFGCGSSREHAVITLKNAGVGAILAESFARIFYRNAINLGLPVLVIPEIGAKVKSGDRLSVDIQTGLVRNETSGIEMRGEQISEYMLHILVNDGIKNLIKNQYEK